MRLAFLGVLMLASSIATASDGSELAKEKSLFTNKETQNIFIDYHSMRLSPDGKHLLYIRRESVEIPARDNRPPRKRQTYRIILRNLASGKDKPLPLPVFTQPPLTKLSSSTNAFDAKGERVVISAGIDANGDGIHELHKEKMEPVIYDIASGKTTSLPVKDDLVISSFDRTGEGLIIMTMSMRTRRSRLFTTPVEKVKLKQHSIGGLPLGICPTADVLPLLLLGPDVNPRSRCILFDLKADKQTAKQPLYENSPTMDDYHLQWTGNGRYLYYMDMKDDTVDGRPTRKMFTRIWDRTAGKEVGIIDKVFPVGPGPGKTTMVLAKRHDRTGPGWNILHNTATGKSWPLGDKSMTVIAAQGKHLIYVKGFPAPKGVYLAEIVMPDKAKDDKDKKATSQPAKSKKTGK